MELFVFDIDGTISRDGAPLTALEKETMNNILKRGDALCLASGRALPTLKIYLDDLIPSQNKFAICSNGADIYNFRDTPIHSSGLTFKDFLYFKNKYADKNPSYEIYAFQREKISSFVESKWVKWEIKTGKMDAMIDFNSSRPKDDDYISKILIATENSEDSVELEKEMMSDGNSSFKIVRSSPYFLEVVNKDAGKYSAIEFIRALLFIDSEKTHTFGDANNDLEMIEKYDGTAMGNATEAVKKAAKRITKSVDEDGIGYILRTHFKL